MAEMTPADVGAIMGRNNNGFGFGGDGAGMFYLMILFLFGMGAGNWGGYGGGNYIKASETKDVCENLGILDTRAKTNADAVSALNTLIADDGTTKTLFGLVVSIDADTGVVSLSEPVVESSET